MSDQQQIKSLKASSLEDIENALASGLQPLLGVHPSVNITLLAKDHESLSQVERVAKDRFRVELFVTVTKHGFADGDELGF